MIKRTITVADLSRPVEISTHVQTTIVVDPREVVPIIFVPGIMGTHLNRVVGDDEEEQVWGPDLSFGGGRRLLEFAWIGAAEKRNRLIGPTGSGHDPERLQVHQPDEDRGWNSVIQTSYRVFLELLQMHRWGRAVRERYVLPVHVFGYNWTNSNSDSGRKLAEYIEAVIGEWKRRYRPCEKVILVTHSMGGLVARAACRLHGADRNVVGVVHGVQPVTGAATAYWRMRAGFERTSSWNPLKAFGSKLMAWALGTNGEEVTALLGNMPGGLQLLPNRDYTDNEGRADWLRFVTVADLGPFERDTVIKSMPAAGDPYAEIYRERTAYWKLVEDEWLDPGNEDVDQAWTRYVRAVDRAKAFHNALGLWQHPESRHLYGTGTDNPTADHVAYEARPIGFTIDAGPTEYTYQPNEGFFRRVSGRWVRVRDTVLHPRRNYGGHVMVFEDEALTRSALLGDSFDGGLFRAELRPGAGSGDGTVPESSGRALADRSMAGEPYELSTAHEGVYGQWLAQRATTRFIESILSTYRD